MTELNLTDLREELHGETLLPSFADVERRAARRRRRARAGRAVAAAVLLALLVPGLAVASYLVSSSTGRPGLLTIGVTRGGGLGDGLPAPNQSTVMTHELVAVDGLTTSMIYGLVDVCRGTQCNLQLVSINLDQRPGRLLWGGLLRSDPRDHLGDVRLAVINDRQVAVSAYLAGEQTRTVVTVTLAAPTETPPPAGTAVVARPIQLSPQNPIAVVAGADGTPVPLKNQPPLDQPRLVGVTNGWWVTGRDPATGHIGVAVSHDHGATWRTTVLNAPDPNVDVALATADGVNVYAVFASAGAAMLTRSANGGRTWTRPAALAIPTIGTSVGVYVTPDGSVVAWTSTGLDTSSLRSKDHGASWSPVSGPVDGPIAVVPGGYLALGAQPEESLDGLHWLTALATYTPIIN